MKQSSHDTHLVRDADGTLTIVFSRCIRDLRGTDSLLKDIQQTVWAVNAKSAGRARPKAIVDVWVLGDLQTLTRQLP